MKPFVVNRYGRIVFPFNFFPFNFFPELDFSVFETLEQFARTGWPRRCVCSRRSRGRCW